jgi:MATE family multidrug resistance protein
MSTSHTPCLPSDGFSQWNGRVWRLAGPIILANISTPLLGAVDTAVMGHLPEAAYIGGVAIGAVIFDFLFWGFGFLQMSTSGFTSQAQGAGDQVEVRATLIRAMALAVALGLLLILLQGPIVYVAFAVMDTSPQVEGLARSYYAIRIWSAPFALANYVVLGWLLGQQRAGLILVLQLALNGTNIALDLLFVVGFGWGIEGVALATLIAQVGSIALAFVFVRRALVVRDPSITWSRLADRGRLTALLHVNANIMIRTLCLIFGFAYFTARGAEMGDLILAANAVLMQFQFVSAYAMDGFAHAVEVLAGNAMGRRSRADFRRAVQVSTLWALGFAILSALIFWLMGEQIIALFSNIAAVRLTTIEYLPWMIVSPLISVWSFQLDGIFVGTTRSAEMRNAMIASLAVYLAACWLLIPALGNHGLWLSLMIFMVARMITLGLYFPRLERTVAST